MYPACSCSLDRAAVFGPQQLPAATSGGGLKDSGPSGDLVACGTLELSGLTWVMIVISCLSQWP